MVWFSALSPVVQGLAATLFTYALTALGAALVFLFREIPRGLLAPMTGFSAGVMLSAAFWSLLSPAVELAAAQGRPAWLLVCAGFLGGGAFVIGSERFLRRVENGRGGAGWRRSALLATAVTLHNLPEGLAVGVAFGSAALDGGEAALFEAMMVALGIGLQNLPEGLCVAMPLRREGASARKSFLIGQASGLVEPAAGVLGALCALAARQLLPLALSFSAGAMIAVVCAELIPEAFDGDGSPAACRAVLLGFALMMALDVALG